MLESGKESVKDSVGEVWSGDWQAYTWKNELAEQKRRISLHLNEVLDEQSTEHNPFHMLERAIGVAALCMRRLMECRLLTDNFCKTKIVAHVVLAKADADIEKPFSSETFGSGFLLSHDLRQRTKREYEPRVIANKFLHASVLGVLKGVHT